VGNRKKRKKIVRSRELPRQATKTNSKERKATKMGGGGGGKRKFKEESPSPKKIVRLASRNTIEKVSDPDLQRKLHRAFKWRRRRKERTDQLIT